MDIVEPTNAAYVRSLLDRHDEAVLLEMEAEAAESGFPIVGRTVGVTLELLARAIGARRVDIIRQFLIETTLITVSGGIMGTLVGISLSRLVAYLAGWSTIVTITSVAVACLVSVTVGIVFGLYPAMRAARLDPVMALHYE